MNVCLLNDSFPPIIDGVATVTMNYAELLMRDQGANVIVGTPRYPDEDYGQYPYPVVAYPSIDTAGVASGYRAGNPFGGKALARLAEFQPDIIHAHCPASALIVGRLLREKTEAPIVLTYHTRYDNEIRRVIRAKPVAREAIAAMVSNIEACDEVWTVSRGAAESLKALGFQGDARVMHNGVDFRRGRADAADVERVTAGYDLPRGVPVFLYVGRMMTYKGLRLILDALKRLSDAGTDFRMVFIGKGPDREKLEKQARALGLMGTGTGPDRCAFVGPVYERDALRAWNTRADLFLFPSAVDTNGLVVREAAACGLASVLIEGSCAAEDVTDGVNGFTIAQTPEALAALLREACGDLDHLRRVGERAMEDLYLSWRDCVATAYERYQAILDEKRRGALPARKKLASDHLVAFTARTLDEAERRRRAVRDLFRDFKGTAQGMMENIQQAEESAERRMDHLAEEIRRGFGKKE